MKKSDKKIENLNEQDSHVKLWKTYVEVNPVIVGQDAGRNMCETSWWDSSDGSIRLQMIAKSGCAGENLDVLKAHSDVEDFRITVPADSNIFSIQKISLHWIQNNVSIGECQLYNGGNFVDDKVLAKNNISKPAKDLIEKAKVAILKMADSKTFHSYTPNIGNFQNAGNALWDVQSKRYTINYERKNSENSENDIKTNVKVKNNGGGLNQ